MEELIKALNTIKEECEKHNGCLDCPMCVDRNCVINRDRPDKWNITEPYTVTKVFK